MKSPLSAAIAARRKPAPAPSESEAPMDADASSEVQEDGEAGESKVAALLASLAPEEKQELFAALKLEMSDTDANAESAEGAPESMTDAKGVLKSTSGERSALADEGVGEELPDEGGGNSFLKYARRNVAKLTKQGQFK